MAKPISFVAGQFLNAGRMTGERKSGMSLDLPAAKAQSSLSSCFSTTLITSDYADNPKTHGEEQISLSFYKHHGYHHPCAKSPCLLNLHFSTNPRTALVTHHVSRSLDLSDTDGSGIPALEAWQTGCQTLC